MTDSEMWKAHREAGQQKRWTNVESSLKILKIKNIPYIILNETICHYRVGQFDFWPSTGKFYNQKTGQKGRGVFKLIDLCKKNYENKTHKNSVV